MDHSSITQLTIQIDGSAISERRLNDLTVKLKNELRNLQPLALDLQREQNAPAGAMSVEAFTLGAITLTLAVAVLPTTIPALIEFLRDWSTRNANRLITIKKHVGEEEIEVSFPEDLSTERLQTLIDTVAGNLASPDGKDHK